MICVVVENCCLEVLSRHPGWWKLNHQLAHFYSVRSSTCTAAVALEFSQLCWHHFSCPVSWAYSFDHEMCEHFRFLPLPQSIAKQSIGTRCSQNVDVVEWRFDVTAKPVLLKLKDRVWDSEFLKTWLNSSTFDSLRATFEFVESVYSSACLWSCRIIFIPTKDQPSSLSHSQSCITALRCPYHIQHLVRVPLRIRRAQLLHLEPRIKTLQQTPWTFQTSCKSISRSWHIGLDFATKQCHEWKNRRLTRFIAVWSIWLLVL